MDSIKKTDVQDADVILYHGNTWLAKAIRLFDGTDVNHASLYVGEDNVGEALGNGLTKRTLKESIEDNEYVILRRLKSHPGTMNPVLEKAKAYIAIGNRYGYEQIVLLAFLGLTRKLTVNAYLKWLLRKVMDEAAKLLMKKGNRQPMICSEFVYRCYNEALPLSTDPYTLDINPFPIKPTTTLVETGKRLSHRGIHKDSLIAWATDVMMPQKKTAQSEIMLSFDSLKGKKKILPPGFKDRKFASMSMDNLIENYLKETKSPSQSTFDMEASIRSAEMLVSINTFAEAYYQASIKKADQGAGKALTVKAVEGEIPAALLHLLDTAEDFVTPGDLLSCQNLYSVGEITP